jgi:antitoxin PrlF
LNSLKREPTTCFTESTAVPLEIRNRLGLKKGDRVEFVVDNGRTTIRPARAPENPFVKYVGALPAFSGVDEANAWVRTLRDQETKGR